MTSELCRHSATLVWYNDTMTKGNEVRMEDFVDPFLEPLVATVGIAAEDGKVGIILLEEQEMRWFDSPYDAKQWICEWVDGMALLSVGMEAEHPDTGEMFTPEEMKIELCAAVDNIVETS